MWKTFTQKSRQKSKFHWLLLFGWIVIGTGVRFINLDAKPPWSDEFATLVFSLGNSFRSVPLDKAIALDTLLQPLQPRPAASFTDVFHNLMTESTHPPVYFLLSHFWLQHIVNTSTTTTQSCINWFPQLHIRNLSQKLPRLHANFLPM